MKRFISITILLFLSGSITFGQSIASPGSSVFALNTSNQDAGNFVVSGFGGSDNLLVSIGLINPPTGTTLRLATTSGVTASTGYILTNNFTRVSFTGTQENVNTVIASLQVNTASQAGSINISVSTTINPSGYYYLPTNGHFYKPVSPLGVSGGAEAFTTLKSNASGQLFKGQNGYLVTITSLDEQDFIHANVPGDNILIALTDKDTEGIWKWDAGPESGNVTTYEKWCSGEPNNASTGEDYVVTKWNGGNCWNDYGPPASNFPASISGYVVEFGTWSDPGSQTFTDFYSNSVSHRSLPPNLTGITATASTICSGSNTQLTASGVQGTVYWYTGSCGGTQVTTGNPITVSPTVSTTYYARNYENGQYSEGCASITITVNPLLQYRSVQSGNWTTLANWQQFDGTSWIAATSYPGQISNSCSSPLVLLRESYLMEIQSGSTIDIPNLKIESTGKLTVKPGGKILVQNQLQLDENVGEAIIVEASTPPPFTCGTSQVTFTYNGSSVTYGTVVGQNGTCWFDRNLGATRVAQASNDAEAYGDYFQWGRAADGHQIQTSGTTNVLADTDTPNHANFITINSGSFDWRSDNNNGRWNASPMINNPCPDGWRVPTAEELEAERQSWTGGNNSAGAFASPLKLPAKNYRNLNTFYGTDIGRYWSSTVVNMGINYAECLLFDSSSASINSSTIAPGYPVRCIKD